MCHLMLLNAVLKLKCSSTLLSTVVIIFFSPLSVAYGHPSNPSFSVKYEHVKESWFLLN